MNVVELVTWVKYLEATVVRNAFLFFSTAVVCGKLERFYAVIIRGVCAFALHWWTVS